MAIAERPTQTFRDLRDWLKRIDDLGELRVVRGARSEDEIGMATELTGRVHGTPALLFDEIPGYKTGFRVLSNALGWFPRLALTLGLDPKASPEDLVKAWQKRVSAGIVPIPAQEVKDGPIPAPSARCGARPPRRRAPVSDSPARLWRSRNSCSPCPPQSFSPSGP